MFFLLIILRIIYDNLNLLVAKGGSFNFGFVGTFIKKNRLRVYIPLTQFWEIALFV